MSKFIKTTYTLLTAKNKVTELTPKMSNLSSISRNEHYFLHFIFDNNKRQSKSEFL